MPKTSDKELHNRVLHSIGDLLPASLFAKNLDGQYVYVNSVFAQTARLNDRQKAIGKTAFDVLEAKRAEIATEEDHLVIETGKPIINRENFDKRFGTEDRWTLVSKVPIRDDAGEIIGVVGMALDIHQRKLAEQRLNQLAAELKRKNASYEADIALARGIQIAMRPHQAESPLSNGLTAAHRVETSEALGGDFVKITNPTENVHLVFICDVMGHGIQSALIAFLLNGLIDRLSQEVVDPGAFLAQLNTRFIEITRSSPDFVFASSLCLVIDTNERTCRYASAGHPLPLILRPGDELPHRVEHTRGQGRDAIGVIDHATYQTDSFPLEAGTAILLYTDGITEQPIQPSGDYGVSNLAEALARHRDASPKAIVDEIFADVAARSGTALQDDSSLIVIK